MEYELNAVAADSKYKGHFIRVTGVVKTIGNDVFGDPFVVLGGHNPYGIGGVQCLAGESQRGAISRLTVGKYVVIEGRVNGQLVYVLLNNCEVNGTPTTD
jgi:hypothetical protein